MGSARSTGILTSVFFDLIARIFRQPQFARKDWFGYQLFKFLAVMLVLKEEDPCQPNQSANLSR